MFGLIESSTGATGGVDVTGVNGGGVGVRRLGGLTNISTGSLATSTPGSFHVRSCNCLMATF